MERHWESSSRATSTAGMAVGSATSLLSLSLLTMMTGWAAYVGWRNGRLQSGKVELQDGRSGVAAWPTTAAGEWRRRRNGRRRRGARRSVRPLPCSPSEPAAQFSLPSGLGCSCLPARGETLGAWHRWLRAPSQVQSLGVSGAGDGSNPRPATHSPPRWRCRAPTPAARLCFKRCCGTQSPLAQ